MKPIDRQLVNGLFYFRIRSMFRRKRICDNGWKLEETIYKGEDPVVFLTPDGQIRMAVSVKKVTAPDIINGTIGMKDYIEVYELNETTGMKYKNIYPWQSFFELNREFF